MLKYRFIANQHQRQGDFAGRHPIFLGPQLMELSGQTAPAVSEERKQAECTDSRAQASSEGCKLLTGWQAP